MKEMKETEDIPVEDQLEVFKKDLSDDANAVEDQRRAANADMRFVHVEGGMWEDFEIGDDFQKNQRAMLEFDMASDAVQGYIGEWNQNRVGVEFKADDDATSKDNVRLLNGIYRADFRDGDGKLATDNAVDYAATCGYGAIKLATEFVDPGDPENDDQRIVWRPIYNPYNTVFWDNSAQMINKKDARWCTELKQFTKKEFEKEFPDYSPSSAFMPDPLPYEWNKPDFIFVACRYQVCVRREDMIIYRNLREGRIQAFTEAEFEEKEERLKADDAMEFVRSREVLRQTVEKTIFSGDDILRETRRIVGRYIPIIPFYGYRAYVDGSERYKGIVRKLKDPSRLFNMQVSQLAENSASGNQRVPIFDPDQMKGGLAEHWANPRNKAYMPARALRDEGGNIIHAGPLGYAEPPVLDSNAAAIMEVAPQYIMSVTGGVAQDQIDPNASGKAINAVIKRENRKTQVINDNIANSVAWSGEVYASMAAEIYNTQRMVSTLEQDGTEGREMLMKVSVDTETGSPVNLNQISNKKFKAYADTGPQYETMREQSVEDLKGLLDYIKDTPAAQQYLPVAMSALINNIDGVGLEPIKDLNRKIMLMRGEVEPKTDEERQMMAQLRAQAQQPDPNRALIEAATEQQQAEARNLNSSALQKAADARKKDAEVVQIMSDIRNENIQTALDVEKQIDEEQQQTVDFVRRGL